MSRQNPIETHSARHRAVEQLNRIEIGGAYAGIAVDKDRAHDPRRERQITEYVSGITRQRRWLDFLIAHFYRGDLGKMEPTLKQILRVGLYDLLFLNTASHAAVYESVELAKHLVRPKAGGLVNGLLRAVLRQKDHLPCPDTHDPARDLAVRHSHPTWLVRRWLRRLGSEETEALLEWDNERPVYGLRIHTLKGSIADFKDRLDTQGVAWQPPAFLDDFVRVRTLQPILRDGLLDEGRCAVQDESMGLVVRLLDPQSGDTVIDTCAAPGGKTLYAAGRMQNQGHILALDVHEGRLRLVEQAATNQGIDIIQTQTADLRALATHPERPSAERVLLDAPCSGLGVLAKRADLRWNRQADDIATLATLQDELLNAAACLVRPDGVLVYSTCTIEPEENSERIAAFLASHPDFVLEPATTFVPDELVTPEGYLATLPHRHHVDGAFAARLRRRTV